MFTKIKFFVEQSWLLMAAAIVFGLLLAVADAAWRPRIEQNTADRFNHLAGQLLTEAERFEPMQPPLTVTVDDRRQTVTVHKGLDRDEQLVGWAFVCEGSGFADKIQLVVGVDAAFEQMAGFRVLSSNETPGFGDRINRTPDEGGMFQKQFTGAPVTTLSLNRTGDVDRIDDQIVAITGATVTSQAVVDMLNAWLEPIRQELHAKEWLN